MLWLASKSTFATVTYSGTDGVYNNVLDSNSVSDCTGCHYNGSGNPDFSSWSGITSWVSVYGYTDTADAADEMKTRINLPTSNGSFMPQGAGTGLNNTEKNLISSWQASGAARYLAPTVSTVNSVFNESKQTKTTSNSIDFDIRAFVNDNGANATYYFSHYKDGDSESWSSAIYTLSWTGGGISNVQKDYSLTSLECGSLYYFRARGVNTVGTTFGSLRSHTTLACNVGPTITSSAITSATEDVLYTYDVDASDPETDTISYSLTTAPSGMTINSSSGLISWTPGEGVTSENVTVSVTDGGQDGAQPDTESFVINVNSVNDAPTITSIAPSSGIENIEYQYAVTVSDPDHTSFTFGLSNEPAGMTVDTDGLITWTPGNGVTTSGSVTVTATDGLGASDNQEFTVSVDTVNDAPVITSTAGTTATEDVLYQYQVDVTDPDDSNNGVDLFFAIYNAPTGMSVSTTGLVTWSPSEGQGNASNIRVEVRDGGENGAVPDEETWSIVVTSVNDAPTFSVFSSEQVNEGQLLAFNAASFLTDPDDNNNGSDISWSLVNEPSGMNISSLGEVTWTPGIGSSGSYTPEIIAADGGENGAAVAQQVLSISVVFEDDDGDGIANYADNCVDTVNSDQLNSDDDEFGNECDSDDDNDGISDDVEITNALDPLDENDGVLDTDNDGLTNLEEFLLCLENNDLICNTFNVDTVAPVITTNGDFEIISTGYETVVELIASAVDFKDGEVEVTRNISGPFRPGLHVVEWQARDSAGNEALVSQTVKVIPLLQFGGATVTGEGRSIEIPIRLNGQPAEYPVEIAFTLAGTANAQDYSLSTTEISIENGLEANLTVNILEDNQQENDESLEVQVLTASANVFSESDQRYELLIVDRNIAPSVSTKIMQGGQTVSTVYQDGGIASIEIEGIDGNDDVLTFAWDQSSNPFSNLDNLDGHTFDPASLTLGLYRLTLEVNDNIESITQSYFFNVAESQPLLESNIDTDGDGVNDASEGVGDNDLDGLMDYLDATNDPSLMASQSVLAEDSKYLQVQSGLKLKLGSMAIESQASGAKVSAINVTSTDLQNESGTQLTLIGGIYDFEIHGLTELNRTVSIVIPLEQAIPLDAELWKFNLNADTDSESGWVPFIVNGEDQIWSAHRIDAQCPMPGDESYELGLLPFYDCLQITITDGGANDEDGSENGVIVDPNSLAIPEHQIGSITANPLNKPSRSPGGSGSLNLLWLCLFIMIAYFGRRNKWK